MEARIKELSSIRWLPISTNFAVPFRGVIKAKEQRDLLLNSSEITYLVGDRIIRREAVRTTALGKLGEMRQGAFGIVCDLKAERVIFYRAEQEKKFYVRMTLTEFKQLFGSVPSMSQGAYGATESLLAPRPSYRRHFGTFFTDLPKAGARMVNIPDARTIQGFRCDYLTIRDERNLLEVFHCRDVRVDRQLIELVESGIPPEVAGFPCLMRRLHLVPVSTNAPTNSQSAPRELLRKGAELAAKALEMATERGLQLLEVTEKGLDDSAFILEESFVECPSLGEFEKQFLPLPGHHDDWD